MEWVYKVLEAVLKVALEVMLEATLLKAIEFGYCFLSYVTIYTLCIPRGCEQCQLVRLDLKTKESCR